MNIEYSEQFLKDLKKLKSTASYASLKRVCFEELPECDTVILMRVLHRKDIYQVFPSPK